MRVNAVVVLLSTLLGVALLSSNTDLFHAFSEHFYWIVGSSAAAFLVGFLFSRFLLPKDWLREVVLRLACSQRYAPSRHRVYVGMFLLFSFLGALDRFLMFGPGFFMPETVMQYRILLTQEGGGNIIKGLSLGNFFIFLMPTYLVAYSRSFSAWQLALVLLIFLFDIYLTSARSSLFLSALIAFYFWSVSKSLSSGFLLKLCAVAGALVGGFNLIGAIVGKSSDELGIVVYAAAPMHAFDELLQAPSLLDGYFLSFFPVQGVLGRIFDFNPSNELPNVFTPLPTNVYSMYGVYFSDYGVLGLLWAMFFIGLFSGFVEAAYRSTGSNVFRVFTALNLAILSLSVFYDYYTTSGVVWMTVLLTPFFFFGKTSSRPGTPQRAGAVTLRQDS